MPRAELRWPPHPYRGGFCITDDTDTAELGTVRIVYDFLAAHGLRTTKTVWASPPEEPCGIPALPASIQRGITLAEPEYLRFCEQLARQGFEITLHGATAGNNRSATTRRAWELIERHFGGAGTFICHAKNADNPYWQEKTVARGPLRRLLGLYAGRHRCSGEDPSSPYFWGDQCLERVRYIRLMRTRSLNTLAANPSMPYFEREKPYVRGWFSATKRSFRDATRAESLDLLEREFGLCVLYQYLCRYADRVTGRVQPAFAEGALRLRERSGLWMDTATRLLDRLRLVQGVFLASRGHELWVINSNDEDATELQIETTAALRAMPAPSATAARGMVRIERLAARTLLKLEFDAPIEAHGRTALHLSPRGTGRANFGHGDLFVNVSAEPWRMNHRLTVPPESFALEWAPGLERLRPRSRASDLELTSLFFGQSAIIAREFLFKGRNPDGNRWLAAGEIALENHDNW